MLDKETYDIALLADNPGIWMDHCHNLKHAADGMVAHLMYEGVTTPYVIGGPPDNQPEYALSTSSARMCPEPVVCALSPSYVP